ncbi:WXG100 family type VII secretion target [Streptomyces sp. NPDC058301]|uniref:WXG100 family type VII secretion target n=1 Tax=Streptomyces sp. NPDC058301 TaxID=3346436 RepID=UPI0036E01E12
MAENKGQGPGQGSAKGAPKAPPVERTDFEQKSHQELWAMVQSMKGDSASHLAKKLADASKTITEIGEDLKAHMSRVVWTGEGAKAFTDWGHDAAMATLGLGAYSNAASTTLDAVSNAIAQVKSSVPEYDPNLKKEATDTQKLYVAAHHDPDGQQDARDASAKLTGLNEKMEGQRQEAVREMKRLADTYVHSGEQIAELRPPVFPPPPAVFVPEDDGRHEMTYTGGSQSSSSRSGRSSATQTGGHSSNGSVTPGGTTGVTGVSHTVAPASVTTTPPHERAVGTAIDGVNTLPPPTHVTPTSPTSNPTPLPVGRPDIGLTPSVGIIPPTFTGGARNGVPEPGLPGGRQATGGLRGPGLPGRSTVGGLPPSALPREPGIVGGRPVPPGGGRPTSGIPRGTVVGDEGRQGLRGTQGMQGRPPMGHGPGGHLGGGGSRGGFSGGRRLAAEPGGIVGGRPTEPGARSGRPFTEGGSGLVRNGSAEGNPRAGQTGRGMIPPGTHGPAGRRDEREGERPDYLTEDEETWQQSDRRIVPPVID